MNKMDYTKMNLIVPKIFKNSNDYDFRTDVDFGRNPFGDIIEEVINKTKKAYDDLFIESLEACGLSKETILENPKGLTIDVFPYGRLGSDSLDPYDVIYYMSEPLFKIIKHFNFYENEILLEVEFL